jgi:hypothetical protein
VKRLASAVTVLLLCVAASGCLTVANDDGPILAIDLYWDARPETDAFVAGTCNSADVARMEWGLFLNIDEPPSECGDDRDGDGTPNTRDKPVGVADSDPCVPDADAEACPTGDSDGDEVPNSLDVDNDPPCDLAELVANRDEDCHNAIDVLEPERGDYTLKVTGRTGADDALWNVECTGLNVLRFDVAYECDIEAP